MSIMYLFILAVALSMDAFTVAICKGLAMQKADLSKAVIVGAYFGFFQAAMPMLGYVIGKRFASYIVAVDHWIAFVLLAVIGINMMKSALSEEEYDEDSSLQVKNMIVLSIATSIDALAVGVAFAFVQVNIILALCMIGVITFIISACGVRVGSFIGSKMKKYAEVAGGVLLILLGIKLLIEGLNLL